MKIAHWKFNAYFYMRIWFFGICVLLWYLFCMRRIGSPIENFSLKMYCAIPHAPNGFSKYVISNGIYFKCVESVSHCKFSFKNVIRNSACVQWFYWIRNFLWYCFTCVGSVFSLQISHLKFNAQFRIRCNASSTLNGKFAMGIQIVRIGNMR